MYKEHFGLDEMPFSIAPDPRYLYMSEQHREALAHLVYGFNSDGGFVLLTGEVGTGKTTVCRCLLDQIPENVSIAFIINPKLTVDELLATICDEFGIPYQKDNKSIKYYIDIINSYLLEAHAKGYKTVLIIDEAQNLNADVLEQLRLLTNLETNKVKLLQIILLGQPELRDKLSRPELRQLSQRIIARYHLGPLSEKDVIAYVKHRLSIAGVKRDVFSRTATHKLFKLSRGIPRLINVLGDRAMLGAFSLGKNEVTSSIMTQASREVFGSSFGQDHVKKAAVWMIAGSVLIIVGLVFAAGYYNKRSSPPAPEHKASQISQDRMQSPSSASPAAPEKVSDLITDHSQWADLMSARETLAPAFQSLFRAWKIDYDPVKDGDACGYARANGLQCYDQRGNLRILTLLDYPAVLKLFTKGGKEFYVTLSDIHKDHATVTSGTDSAVLSLKDIESYWLGDYTLLWKAPQNYQGIISPGDSNILVPWLDEQLSTDQNAAHTARSTTIYDDELAERVRRYQVASGLFPDGIVGPQTLMRLYRTGDADIPSLLNKNPDKRN